MGHCAPVTRQAPGKEHGQQYSRPEFGQPGDAPPVFGAAVEVGPKVVEVPIGEEAATVVQRTVLVFRSAPKEARNVSPSEESPNSVKVFFDAVSFTVNSP